MKKIINKYLIFTALLSFFLNSNLFAFEKNILSIGDENAEVTVKVFSSLTCPHCANFHIKIFENLKKDYIDTKKVKFEHHGFPLDLAALNAEKILRSVKNKEKSFQFLSEIYRKQDQWSSGSDIEKINDSIKKIALKFGLSSEIIEKFIENEEVQDQILNERINAQKKYKISSTPTIYINDKKYEGTHEYKKFKKEIEKYL
jgi:protein-disulfide isomerase